MMENKVFRKVKNILLTALTVALFTGCTADNSERPAVRAELKDIVIHIDERSPAASSSDQTSFEPEPAESSPQSSSSAGSESTSSSSGASTHAASRVPQVAPLSEPENGTVMYVTRQKYGKKAPNADAERSRFYSPSERVVVVEETETDYYKLDNGDYIYRDYVSKTGTPEVTRKVNSLPSDTPVKTADKQSGYDRAAALKYAAAHWDKDLCLCAEFASECLTAGGLKYDLASSTDLYNKLEASGLGYAVRVTLNEDGTANCPEDARAGDIIFYYCSYENMTVHTAVCSGKTKDGLLKAYSHNPYNNGEEALVYEEFCTGGCNCPLTEIFVFLFY